MRKPTILSVVLFLELISENIDTPPRYVQDNFWTPASLFNWFTERLPIKLTLFELCCIILAFTTSNRGQVARPIRNAMIVSVIAVFWTTIHGQLSGGVSDPIYTLTRAWLFGLVFGVTATNVLANVADFVRLSNAIVLAAIWRAALVVLYYLSVRHLTWPDVPPHMTTHEDSVLFCVGLVILLSRTIEFRNKASIRNLAIAAPILFAGMQYNNRRLVWIAVVASLLTMYFILPSKSKVARRINRTLRVLSPIIAIYFAVGWDKTDGAFKPIAVFQSMISAKKADGTVDLSTKARDNENLGLVTMINERPLIGTGFGHEWLELDKSGTVSLDIFPMYKFSPHNSVLSLFAYAGALGFTAQWMIIAVAVYLNVRAYRKSANPAERVVVMTGVSCAIAYLNQAFGDMGLIHIMPATLLGLSYASAARFSVSSGAWPLKRKAVT
jgi:hypothetical protein